MPTTTFQQGSAYSGTIDTTLYEAKPGTVAGGNTSLYVDAGTGTHEQALLEFSNLFGTGPGQIPVGATITSAVLSLNVTNTSDHGGTISRMTTAWDSNSTWNSLGSGVQLGVETAATPDLSLGKVAVGTDTFNVTSSLQAWLSGATTADQANAANEGWLFNSTHTDAWVFSSSESGTAPSLTVTYTMPDSPPPPPASQLALEGLVSLNEGTSASPTSFVFTVDRTGDTSGAVSVDYAVTGSGTNPADATDFASGVLPTGTVSFAAGQTSATITVNVAADSNVENDETFLLSLSNPTNGAQVTGATATGTIINDDVATPPPPSGPVTATFQQGSAYTGTIDTTIDQANPNATGGTSVYLYDDAGAGVQKQSLLEFSNLFGSGAGQIPIGATITSATLTVNVANGTVSGGGIYRMSSAWNASSTWNSLGGGVQVGTETVSTADATLGKVGTGAQTFNVTSSLQGWLSGATTTDQANGANQGWLFSTTSTDGWHFSSSEGSSAPILTVTYTMPNSPPPVAQLALEGPVSLNEGTSASPTSFTFTVDRTGDTSGAVSVDYAVTGSGANPADASDFASGVLPSGTVTFAAGQTSATITVNVAADSNVENNENFLLTLTNPTNGAHVTGATATGTIINDDTVPPPASQLALEGPVSHAEGTSVSPTSFVFTVDRTGDTSGAVSVNYSVTGSGAHPADASDFASGVLPSGTVTFAAGQTSATITVNVAADSNVENDENFAVTLSNPTNGAQVTGATATGTIVNDDVASPPPGPVTTTFQQGSAYSGTIDTTLYEAKPGTVAGGNTSLYVDAGTGTHEQALLEFSNLFGTGPGQIPVGATITSAVLSLNVTNTSDHGGTISRMTTAWDSNSTWNSLGSGVQLGVETAATPDLSLGKVAVGTDTFNVTSSLQAWLSGATTADQANAANEGWLFNSTHTDAWVFSSSESGTAPSLTVTYTMPDSPPPPPASQLALEGLVSLNEGTSASPTSFVFTVDRTGDTSGAVSVDYAVTGSGTNPADATDFASGVLPTGTVSFAAGQTSATITVNVAADSNVENDETFLLSLSNPTNGAQVTGATATGTIINDDVATPPPPGPSQLALDGPVSHSEGTSESPTAFTFTVDRTGDTSMAGSVDYAVSSSGANAAAFSDFTNGILPAGTVNFAAGQTSATITVNVVGDTSVENNENFTLSLSNASNGATITGATATGTILNDDSVDGLVLGVREIDGSTYGNGNPSSPDHYGSTDPTDIAYNPADGTFYLVDSEIDEKPFYGTVNMWHLDSQGHLISPDTLEAFTKEPTGAAIWVDPSTSAQYLFISDDDQQRVFEVALNDPSTVLHSFSTKSFGCQDPEDICINQNNGDLFVLSENNHKIYEVTQAGKLVATTVLPNTFVPHADPNMEDGGAEAIAYDPVKDVFWVSGGFNEDIFEVNRSGQILDVVNTLEQYPNPSLTAINAPQTVYPKGLELAPSSDGSGHLSLWVTDYGLDQYPDGRLFEIMLNEMAPQSGATSSATTSASPLALQSVALASAAPAAVHESLAEMHYATLHQDGPFGISDGLADLQHDVYFV